MSGKTVASAATTEAALKCGLKGQTRAGNKGGAELVGQTIRATPEDKGITRVVLRSERLPLSTVEFRPVADAARKVDWSSRIYATHSRKN